MNFEQAIQALSNGQKVRLPEWRGYWKMDESGSIVALTKDGEYFEPWLDKFKDREDWEIATGLDFGWAICALKAGKLVTRAGWNGKGMFLFLRPGDTLTYDIVEKAKSLPQSLKDWALDQGHKADKTTFDFTAYICMKAADGSIVNGWLASQTDMLSEDWQLFEP